MIGTRVGVHPHLEGYEYVCGRCGIRRTFKVGRPRPELCGDCKYVLDYRGESEEPVWTADTMRVAHAQYVRGLRDDWTRAGQLAYDRARARRRREAMTAEERAAETVRLEALRASRGVKTCPHCGVTKAAPNMPRHIRAHNLPEPGQVRTAERNAR